VGFHWQARPQHSGEVTKPTSSPPDPLHHPGCCWSRSVAGRSAPLEHPQVRRSPALCTLLGVIGHPCALGQRP
jgi:hypothetical protein